MVGVPVAAREEVVEREGRERERERERAREGEEREERARGESAGVVLGRAGC
jgi:hypothetical protein